jgi:pimeloyl-ACP methyl ester carboxylesterase
VFVQRDHDTVGAMAQSVLDASPERFTLITHGMGGFVAFEMLRRAPERIQRLVLMSALAPADTPKQTERRMGYIRLVEQGRFDGIIEERIPMLVHPSRTGDGGLTAILRRMASDTGAEVFQRQQRAIMARPDSRPMLASISCPTMLVFGRQDGITTIEHQNEMVKAIPDVRLEIIEDCGHMMTLEKPDAVNALLKGFLQ